LAIARLREEPVVSFIANFISILGEVIVISIIIRALLSWFMPTDSGPFGRILADITDPILRPIRRALPPLGGFDLSPILAIILVQIISSLLVQVVRGSA
jgi:YggT family protein